METRFAEALRSDESWRLGYRKVIGIFDPLARLPDRVIDGTQPRRSHVAPCASFASCLDKSRVHERFEVTTSDAVTDCRQTHDS